jgi:undecaprenyl pyrophosphate phosphatase UppP
MKVFILLFSRRNEFELKIRKNGPPRSRTHAWIGVWHIIAVRPGIDRAGIEIAV